jgi:hypothetical protein
MRPVVPNLKWKKVTTTITDTTIITIRTQE